jgi:hypothetical protein
MDLAPAILHHLLKVRGMQDDVRAAVGALGRAGAAAERANVRTEYAAARAGSRGATIGLQCSKKRQAITEVLLDVSRALLVHLLVRDSADGVWCGTLP